MKKGIKGTIAILLIAAGMVTVMAGCAPKTTPAPKEQIAISFDWDKVNGAVCLAKFPDADQITPLLRTKKMTKSEAIIDFLVQPGVVQVLDYMKENPECYLVEKGGKQYLVKITKDFIKTSELTEKVSSGSFVIGSYKYKKTIFKLTK